MSVPTVQTEPSPAAGKRQAPTLAALPDERIGAIVTAFKIGPVLADTLLSLVNQRGVSIPCILLIIDGCPSTQTTAAIANRYARGAQDRVRYMWVENGGVSRARNTAVKWMLAEYPDLSALFLLDGDDLLPDLAVRNSAIALRAAQRKHDDRKIGWVLGDRLNFGDDQSYIDTPADFRKTNYLSANLAQPGCLYDRALFDAGVLWDEDMRTGVEDWEFWLEAIKQGFEGTYSDRTLLYYRQLSGNRSSVNRRNDALNVPYMRSKHAQLFTARRLFDDEERTFPRFAEYRRANTQFELYSDPAQVSAVVDATLLDDAIGGRAQRADAAAYIHDPYFPDVIGFFADGVRELLANQGLLRGLLASVHLLATQGFQAVSLSLQPVKAEQRSRLQREASLLFVIEEASAVPRACSAHFLVASRITGAGVDHTQVGRQPSPFKRHALLLLRNDALAPGADVLADTQLQAMRATVARINHVWGRESKQAIARTHAAKVFVAGGRHGNHEALTHNAIGCAALFPARMAPGQQHIALILPLAGDAMLLTLTARIAELDPQHVRVSLFSQAGLMSRPPAALQPYVDNVSTLLPFVRNLRRPGGPHYMGVPPWQHLPRIVLDRITGQLAPFDSVVYFGSEAMAPVLQRLRGLGVDTAICLGSSAPIRRELRRPSNKLEAMLAREDPLGTLNFPGAYRYAIVEDEQAAARLASLGISSTKIDPGGYRWLDHLRNLLLQQQAPQQEA